MSIPVLRTTGEHIRPFANAQWAQFNREQGIGAEAFTREKRYLATAGPNGDYVSYLSYVISRGVVYIESCIVDPAFRRQDHATHLILVAEQDGREAGCHASWAKTRADNIPMRNLLCELEYTEVAVPVRFELGVDWVMYFKEL